MFALISWLWLEHDLKNENVAHSVLMDQPFSFEYLIQYPGHLPGLGIDLLINRTPL
ncbi:MAG: hypothetical protein AB8E74_04830 [Prochlorococcus sp.]|nr:hypothetical protein [Prochlorococcaceae cyanobacterium Fu_MAG_50]